MPKIRMLMDVNGTFHGQDGVKTGDVVDVDKDSAESYVALGYAEKDTGKGSGPADEAKLVQVATHSTEYLTVAEAESKEEEHAADEAEAVNTPAPNVVEDTPPAKK